MVDLDHGNMSFLDHLEELRWRLIKALTSVLIGAIVTYFFIDQVIEILILPTRKLDLDLQVLKVQGMFLIKWGLAFVGGVILAIPVLTYQTWKFIIPGLLVNERKYLFPLIIFTFISFLAGVFFAYIVIIPFSLNFFTSIGYGDIQNNFSINYYFSFITWLLLGTGLIFELPVLTYILSSIGILTPPFMRHYRRHSIVIILILSAMITPPDPISLFLMALPLTILYEISIGVSWLATKTEEETTNLKTE